jgi:hypothetical protein
MSTGNKPDVVLFLKYEVGKHVSSCQFFLSTVELPETYILELYVYVNAVL